MKLLSQLLMIVTLVSIIACSSGKKAEKFSKKKPYCVEIKKERSYYQAKKIADRLKEMNIEAFIVSKKDTADGEWFSIMSGAIEYIDSAKSYQKSIAKLLNIEGVRVVNYFSLKNFAIANEGDTSIIRENKKIITKKPDVQANVYETLEKFPESNSLFLNQLSVVNLDANTLNTAYLISSGLEFDLPSGITIKKIADKCNSLAEVVYRDNLYSGNITLSIMKIKEVTKVVSKASFLPTADDKYYDIPGIFADYILDTDVYKTENKTKVEISAYVKLYGYKVTIETKKEGLRTYYVLIDANYQYLIFFAINR